MGQRRGIPKGGVNWFLRDWMDRLGVKQRDMIERAGWSKATASQLYTGQQDYSPKVVNEAAQALKARPYELLMSYDEAMTIRSYRASAAELVRLAPVKSEEAERASA